MIVNHGLITKERTSCGRETDVLGIRYVAGYLNHGESKCHESAMTQQRIILLLLFYFFIISDESTLTQQRIINHLGFHPVDFSSASRSEVLGRFMYFFCTELDLFCVHRHRWNALVVEQKSNLSPELNNDLEGRKTRF